MSFLTIAIVVVAVVAIATLVPAIQAVRSSPPGDLARGMIHFVRRRDAQAMGIDAYRLGAALTPPVS